MKETALVTRVYQLLIGAFALLFGFMGASFYLNPVVAAGDFGLEALSPVGMNALRGDLGGLFITSCLLLCWGLWRNNPHFFRAVAVLMLSIAVGRLIGFVVSSVAQASLLAFIVELVTAVVLLRAAAVEPWRSGPSR